MQDDRISRAHALGGMFLLDEKGIEEMDALHQRFVGRLREIETESKHRSAESNASTKSYIVGIYRKQERPSLN